MNEEILFFRALSLDGHKRPAFLRDACSGADPAHRRMEALLAAHECETTILDRPLPYGADLLAVLFE